MTTLPQPEATVVLMESGWLQPDQVGSLPLVVRRGMAVRTGDDCAAGYVAAVVLDRTRQQITHLLLMRHCQQPEYHLLPVTAIRGVGEDEIRLAILHQVVTTLPRWQSA